MDELIVKQIKEVYPNLSEYMIKLALDYVENQSDEDIDTLLKTEAKPTRVYSNEDAGFEIEINSQ